MFTVCCEEFPFESFVIASSRTCLRTKLALELADASIEYDPEIEEIDRIVSYLGCLDNFQTVEYSE
jgi:hypothetical protein